MPSEQRIEFLERRAQRRYSVQTDVFLSRIKVVLHLTRSSTFPCILKVLCSYHFPSARAYRVLVIKRESVLTLR
jgi:hypothetical protein